MACKQGIRKNIEESIKRHARDRELDKTCPYRALWRQLHAKVYVEKSGSGFNSLTNQEKTYWVLNCLSGEVYNGGFDQYFHNSSGSHYELTVQGLEQVEAYKSLALLQNAKRILFGNRAVPESTTERRQLLAELFPNETPDSLNALDSEYWQDPDNLPEKLESFALKNGLVLAQQGIQPDGPASGGPAG